jgi:hypothetical protein
LVASIKRLKKTTAECAGPTVEWTADELSHGNSVVMPIRDPELRFMVVKAGRAFGFDESIQREIEILKKIGLFQNRQTKLSRCDRIYCERITLGPSARRK